VTSVLCVQVWDVEMNPLLYGLCDSTDHNVLNDDIMLYRRRLETRDSDINSCLQCLLRENIKREVVSIYRLLYNQRSRPLVVRRDNAALTHEAYTSIQPEESPSGGQQRECSFKT